MLVVLWQFICFLFLSLVALCLLLFWAAFIIQLVQSLIDKLKGGAQ